MAPASESQYTVVQEVLSQGQLSTLTFQPAASQLPLQSVVPQKPSGTTWEAATMTNRTVLGNIATVCLCTGLLVVLSAGPEEFHY